MKILVDDRDREKRLAEKAEGLRSTLTRKETQLKQVKLQLDKTKVTIAELEAAAHKDKLDTDKSVKYVLPAVLPAVVVVKYCCRWLARTL